MKKYKTVNISDEIYDSIKKIVENKRYLYRNVSDFVNSVLREKVDELRLIEMKRAEMKSSITTFEDEDLW